MRQKKSGGSMSQSELKDGGILESFREKNTYQYTGTESSTFCNSITDQTRTEHLCSHEIRQHNSFGIFEQKWGNQIKQQTRIGLTVYPKRL